MRWFFLLFVLSGCTTKAQTVTDFEGCFSPSYVKAIDSSSGLCFTSQDGSWKQENRKSDFDLGYWKSQEVISEYLLNKTELNARCIQPNGIAPYLFCKVTPNIEIRTVGNSSGNRSKSRSGYILIRSAIHYKDQYVVEEYSKLN